MQKLTINQNGRKMGSFGSVENISLPARPPRFGFKFNKFAA